MMQNVKEYFQILWKSSSSSRSQPLTLPPSIIQFTDPSVADLHLSESHQRLLNEISEKLLESVVPPKLQIYRDENQWFALNNSHLLVYRQLERLGQCDAVGRRKTKNFSGEIDLFASVLVCDWVRNEDVPLGIRQTLRSTCHENVNEVIYCSTLPADSCACYDQSSDVTDDENEEQEESGEGQ